MSNTSHMLLTDLTPINLKYNQIKGEKLNVNITRYKNGYIFYELKGFKNFQDVAVNKNSCLVLTSAISLQTIFNTAETLSIGKLPVSVVLQPRNYSNYYLKEQTRFNTISLALTSSSVFYIQPIVDSNEVEVFVNGKYLQVREEYPYQTYLNEVSLDENEINRQRYQVVQKNDIIFFKTKTNSGYRYLSINNDNILRATGLVLNESIINDYIFRCIPVTTIEQETGFLPSNNWTTYYFDVQSKTENKSVDVNQNFEDTYIHYLIDFPYEDATDTGVANINVAGLKTNITPTGGPAPVNNNYSKDIITTN